jgi:formate C-acetyltransferase
MILLAKRYAARCRELIPTVAEWRQAELASMADSLDHIIEYPCRSFWEAIQAINFYQLCLTIDGQNHGVTCGRIDQYAGHFLANELASGTITLEFAQEIVDSFTLKMAEYCKGEVAQYNRGELTVVLPEVIENPDGTCTVLHEPTMYMTGQHYSIGGVTADGSDASNKLTELILQSYIRLYADSPSISRRIHPGTPEHIGAVAIESSRRSGGMPTFENDEVIIPALVKKGFSLVDARNYTLIGCVEPAGCGNEYPCCGGSGRESFWNFLAVVVLAINNGKNPLTGYQGPTTGFLYDFATFAEFQEAFVQQAHYYLDWHISCTNILENVFVQAYPNPLASATMDGCMEQALDVTAGGAKYNSTGMTCCGIGNVTDSLAAIKYLCFDQQLCTSQELYDAIAANWQGFEELRVIIKDQVPHYGNGDAYADDLANWAMHVFTDRINAATGPRGGWRPGTFTMTIHMMFGAVTAATPDGRATGEPLAEAISPRQGYDQHGPTAYILSASRLPHSDIGNGDQLNIKFSATVLQSAEGPQKLHDLITAYFDLGGMQVQFNAVGVETLHEAQENPEEYRDLIVRIAGFSTYFVEMPRALQDDFITRTEHGL